MDQADGHGSLSPSPQARAHARRRSAAERHRRVTSSRTGLTLVASSTSRPTRSEPDHSATHTHWIVRHEPTGINLRAINRRGHGPDKLMSLLDAERVLGRVCVTLLVH